MASASQTTAGEAPPPAPGPTRTWPYKWNLWKSYNWPVKKRFTIKKGTYVTPTYKI